MRKVTINDIAKVLNVTPSTVSRALAGNLRVSLKTRELVKAKAKEMGYKPNSMASALRKGTSDTIGIIIPRINRHFFSNIISGVQEVLDPAGYNLMVMQTGESLAKEKKAIETLMNNRVGGLLLSISSETQNGDHLSEVIQSGVPLVQFDRVLSEVQSVKIVNDNRQGAYIATKHLLKMGYKRIAYFGGNPKLDTYINREKGYKEALSEYDVPIDSSIILHDTITRITGKEAMVSLVKKKKIDAVFSAGDYSALGAIDALKQMGLSAPEDYGVVGFANEPFSEIMSPSLSTVEQFAQEMGNKAAVAIIKSIKEGPMNYIETIDTRFIGRESSIKS